MHIDLEFIFAAVLVFAFFGLYYFFLSVIGKKLGGLMVNYWTAFGVLDAENAKKKDPALDGYILIFFMLMSGLVFLWMIATSTEHPGIKFGIFLILAIFVAPFIRNWLYERRKK